MLRPYSSQTHDHHTFGWLYPSKSIPNLQLIDLYSGNLKHQTLSPPTYMPHHTHTFLKYSKKDRVQDADPKVANLTDKLTYHREVAEFSWFTV